MKTKNTISPTLKRYMIMGLTSNKKKQASCIEKLEGFIATCENKIVGIKEKFEEKEFPNLDSSNPRNKRMIKVIKQMILDINNQKFEFETGNLQKCISAAKYVLEIIRNDSTVKFQAKNFIIHLTKSLSNKKEYSSLNYQRKSLMSKISRYCVVYAKEASLESTKNAFLEANQRFNDDLSYSPPSVFDTMIEDYILEHRPMTLIVSLANFIAYGEPDEGFFNTMVEFINGLIDDFKTTTTNIQIILFTSALRFLFNEAYQIKPELRSYLEEDEKFLIKCEIFAKQPASSLKLTKDVGNYYVPGLPIRSLFKNRQVQMLREMDFITNPIDMMAQIYFIIDSLAQFFGSDVGVLSFDDTLTLFLALLSMSPPANCISIVKYINKWAELQSSSVFRDAMNFFVIAVEHISQIEIPEGYMHNMTSNIFATQLKEE